MVEFGLKLEDNKVSEWSEYYLNYAKLKATLKAAKAIQKKYDEQAKKKPQDAAKILEAHRSGNQNYVTATPSPSAQVTPSPSVSNFQAVAEDPSALPPQIAYDLDLQTSPNEQTGLLSSSTPNDSPTAAEASSLKNIKSFSSALSDISGYFGSRYERTLRGYLKELDERSHEFGEKLVKEQSTVSTFYAEKLGELQKRLQVLLESVADSPYINYALPLERVQEENGKMVFKSRPSAMPRTRPSGMHRTRPSLMNRISRISTSFMHMDPRNQRNIFGVEEYFSDDDEPSRDKEKDDKAVAEVDSIKRALIDQYRTAKLLHNFAILNYTGFVKIVKKHDKSLPENKGRFKALVEPANLFNEGKEVDMLATKYEQYFADWFCEGDIRAAHAQMLPKRGDGLEMDWSQLRLGYRMGMCAVLALWVCWDCIWGLVTEGHSTIGGRAAFPVFRACGGILLLQWFWGCSVFIWTRYRINYIYLFDFNPRIVATPLGIFEEAVDNSLIFMLLMLLYYKSGANDIPKVIPSGGYPFILVLYTTVKLIFPLRTRVPMWQSIWKVVTITSPTFFYGYIGDIFTSMVKVFQDIAWTVCWVFTGSFTNSEDLKKGIKFGWPSHHWYKNILIPLICLFPLAIRFFQCLRRYIDSGDRFPHLANATKYALSQTVTLFGAFHPLYLEHSNPGGGRYLFQVFWMIVFISSSLYSFFWDVYMDWGLGRKKYGYLGQSLMYPRRYYYFSIMAIDLVLRFMWVLTLVPPSSGAKFEVPSYLSAVTMMLELFRRTVWGFLRLENEHRGNAAGFRRVGFVPLHFNTGHKHQYKDKKKESGQTVLREVIVIALAVVAVCVASVVAAQRATRAVKDEL